MAMIDKVKIRLGISDDSQDLLLAELIEDAASLYFRRRYPVTPVPDDMPLSKQEESWVVRATVEIYGKLGVEGQTYDNENGKNRGWETGTISRSLLQEITPVAGVYS